MPEAADAALREAAEWFALLNAGDADPGERERWQRWCEADPRHASAWARVEAMRQRLAGALPAQVDKQVATRVLARSLGARRQSLRRLGGLALAVGTGGAATWLATSEPDWAPWSGDVRTAVGERRELVLADGGRLWLNTDSAIRLAAGGPRTLRLLRGELLLATAGAWAVETAEGLVRAGAARFGVLRADGRSRVSVFEGAVDLLPAAGASARTLRAREQAAFDRDGVGSVGPARALREAWSTGVLVADDLRLADLVDELARYVPGHVGCSPEVADLRVVGAFPLADPERTFRALEAALPVRVTRRWGWWTQVSAR
jgi:transmembrane sensor